MCDRWQANAGIKVKVPEIELIVQDVRNRLADLMFEANLPVQLDDDCAAAIVAYTHDRHTGQKNGNLYFELNAMLRQRGPAQREMLTQTWGNYMQYMMTGLGQLPDFDGWCWRGYNHGTKATILKECEPRLHTQLHA